MRMIEIKRPWEVRTITLCRWAKMKTAINSINTNTMMDMTRIVTSTSEFGSKLTLCRLNLSISLQLLYPVCNATDSVVPFMYRIEQNVRSAGGLNLPCLLFDHRISSVHKNLPLSNVPITELTPSLLQHK